MAISEKFREMKTLKSVASFCVTGAVLGLLASGCNLGNAPAGASETEMKSAINKYPLDQRAKWIMSFPGPLADKQAKIKKMYQDAGQVAPAEVLQPSNGATPGGTGKPQSAG